MTMASFKLNLKSQINNNLVLKIATFYFFLNPKAIDECTLFNILARNMSPS